MGPVCEAIRFASAQVKELTSRHIPDVLRSAGSSSCSVHVPWHMTVDTSLHPPVSCIRVLSVPVLVLVVPPVEVDVERHDAAGNHARDQSPEDRNQKKSQQTSQKWINRPQTHEWVHLSQC